MSNPAATAEWLRYAYAKAIDANIPGVVVLSSPLIHDRHQPPRADARQGARDMVAPPAPYYQDNHVTIYHGDCRDILPALEFDVVVTDPPYGIGYLSNMHGPRHETAATAARPVSIVGDEDTTLRDFALSFGKPALSFGSWKANRPQGTKHILTWCKGDHLGMGDLSIPWRPNTEEVYVIGSGFAGHRGSSVLNYPGPVSWASKGRQHQHEKPVDLMRDLIAKCPPGTIADPFMGSGTTLRAAKDLGRKAIGIEIDERYCEIAARRMGQEVLF